MFKNEKMTLDICDRKFTLDSLTDAKYSDNLTQSLSKFDMSTFRETAISSKVAPSPWQPL